MSAVYDVVIIGGGIGGLTTGCMLGKKGLNVVVVEKNQEVGGYASSITLGNFIFDVGAQDITFLGRRGMEIIRELGIEQEYIKITPHCKAMFPNHVFNWASEKETKNYFIREFPGEKEGLHALFGVLYEMYFEIDRYSTNANITGNFEKYPQMLRFSNYTALQFLREFIKSDQLISLLSTLCMFYQGSPPSRLSAFHFAGLLMSYFDNGAFYYDGGCSAFTKRLRGIIEQNGGTIRTNAEVKQILIRDDRASGIVVDGGETIQGSYIVSNIDAKQTISKLTGPEKFSPAYLSRLHRMKPALSRCQLLLGMEWNTENLPFAAFYKQTYDTDQEFVTAERNRPVSLRCFIPTTVDASLAPAGHHALSIAIPASYDFWMKHYESGQNEFDRQIQSLSNTILSMLKKSFPSMPFDKIVVQKMLTPLDLKRFTGNSNGALYGWELTPQQSGNKRLSFRTSVQGLYLVGQWTVLGGSACLVFRSADIVSSSILREHRHD